MKLLLDENLPHDRRHEFAGHDVFTVKFMGWSNRRNGDLLRDAASTGFDAMITMDNGVPYQQNIGTLQIAVVGVEAKTNRLVDLLPLMPALIRALAQVKPGKVIRVA